MQIFQWTDDYLIDINRLDTHHRQLVHLLNKLHDDYSSGASDEESGLTLVELLDYAAFHLNYEAKMIVVSDRAISEKYVKDINLFRGKMLKIQNYYFKSDRDNSRKMLSFMNRWIANHITGAKAFFSNFAAGASPPCSGQQSPPGEAGLPGCDG